MIEQYQSNMKTPRFKNFAGNNQHITKVPGVH